MQGDLERMICEVAALLELRNPIMAQARQIEIRRRGQNVFCSLYPLPSINKPRHQSYVTLVRFLLTRPTTMIPQVHSQDESPYYARTSSSFTLTNISKNSCESCAPLTRCTP